MNLTKITKKASGRLYNAVKKEDGKGFINPDVEFQGIDVENLPPAEELLILCGDKAARYLAEGYNNDAFEAAKDPFDPLIPKDFSEEKYKWARTALINMVKFTGMTPADAAKLFKWNSEEEQK